MQLTATVSYLPGDEIGVLNGTIEINATDSRRGTFDFCISGLEVFAETEEDSVQIEVSKNGERVCQLKQTGEPLPPPEVEVALRNFLLLQLTLSAIEQFDELLTLMGVNGKPFASSPDIGEKEASWLVLKIIAGKKDAHIDLARFEREYDTEKLLSLLFD